MSAFELNRWLRATGGLGVLLLATNAVADIRIQVAAKSTNASASDDAVFDASVKQASGSMFAAPSGEGGSIHEGPFACGVPCGSPALTPGATAAGTADLSVGHFGVATRAWANPPEAHQATGSAVVQASDMLFANGPLTMHIRIDVVLDASQSGEAYSEYEFHITQHSGDSSLNTFSFWAWDDPHGVLGISGGGGSGAEYRINDIDNQLVERKFFDTVPSVFEIDVPLHVLGSATPIQIYNAARSEAEDGSVTSVSSLNSGWLGIEGDYTSAAGYTYQGFSQPVPEPGTALLWLLGGLALSSAARRPAARA